MIIACLVAFLAPSSAIFAATEFGASPVPTSTGTPSGFESGTSDNPFNKNLVSEVSGKLPSEYNRSSDPILLIVRIIRILLSFVGIGLTGLLVYAGFQYMTAAGDDGKIDESKATIRNAVIGLIIIMSSWTLSTFIINRLRATTRAGATRLESSVLQDAAIYGTNQLLR